LSSGEWGVKGDENRVCLLGAAEKEGERRGEWGQRRAIIAGGSFEYSVKEVYFCSPNSPTSFHKQCLFIVRGTWNIFLVVEVGERRRHQEPGQYIYCDVGWD
jgi:hypothetical protein